MKKPFTLLPFLLVLIFSVPAAELLHIDDVLMVFITESRDLRSAEEDVRRAESEIGSMWTTEKSKVILNSDISTGDSKPGDGFWDMLSGSLKISVPLLPSLHFGAGISSEKGGDISVSFYPFADPNISPKDYETYRKAVIELNTVSMNLSDVFEDTVLGYLLREKELDYTEKMLDLAQQEYEMTKKLYDMGEVYFSDLQDSIIKLTSRRQGSFTAQKNLLESIREVKTLLGPDFGVFSLQPLDVEELLIRAEKRNTYVQQAEESLPYSRTAEILTAEIRSLEDQLANTPSWKPDLSLGASALFPKPGFTISASLSFSPSDVKNDERELLKSAAASKRYDLAAEEYLLDLKTDVYKQNISIFQEALNAAQLDLRQAQLFYEEAELLYTLGERTKFELLQAELNAVYSEFQVFRQAAALLKSMNEYLQLYQVTWHTAE